MNFNKLYANTINGATRLLEAGNKTDVILALQDSKIDPNLIANIRSGHQQNKGEAALLVLHYLWETYDANRPWMFTLFERGLHKALNNDLRNAKVVIRNQDGNKITKTVLDFDVKANSPNWYFYFTDETKVPWERMEVGVGVFFQDQDADIDHKVLNQLINDIKRVL